MQDDAAESVDQADNGAETKEEQEGVGEEVAEHSSEPRRLLKLIRFLTFILVPLIFVGFIGFSLFRTRPPRDLIDQPGPRFVLPLLAGGQLSSSQLKGKPVVINFWASWCGPCREEAKTLEQSWKTHRGEVHFVGINVSDAEDDAKAFAKEFGLSFPLVRDTESTVYRKLGVRGMPETFFLDHEYKFAAVGSGRQVGQRGSTKVLGAVQPALLEGQLKDLLDRQKESQVGSGGHSG